MAESSSVLNSFYMMSKLVPSSSILFIHSVIFPIFAFRFSQFALEYE